VSFSDNWKTTNLRLKLSNLFILLSRCSFESFDDQAIGAQRWTLQLIAIATLWKHFPQIDYDLIITGQSLQWVKMALLREYYISAVTKHSETKSRVSFCVTANSHTSIRIGAHEHHSISSSLTHTPLHSYIVNITHQHDNDRTLLIIYCYACCFVGLLELHKNGKKPGKEPSRATVWPPLLYIGLIVADLGRGKWNSCLRPLFFGMSWGASCLKCWLIFALIKTRRFYLQFYFIAMLQIHSRLKHILVLPNTTQKYSFEGKT